MCCLTHGCIPLVMGLEEHLLHMFREDFEFHDDAGPSHHGGHAPRAEASAPAAPAAAAGGGSMPPGGRAPPSQVSAAHQNVVWLSCAERELKKIPFFRGRGKAGGAIPRPSPPKKACTRFRSTRFMKRRRIMLDSQHIQPKPYRFVVVTLDAHAAGPAERVLPRLQADFPGLDVSIHAAAEFRREPRSAGPRQGRDQRRRYCLREPVVHRRTCASLPARNAGRACALRCVRRRHFRPPRS